MMQKQCAWCKKRFTAPEGWVYRHRHTDKGNWLYFCRWNHQMAWERAERMRQADKASNRGRCNGKPVICRETGQVYPSAAAAGEALDTAAANIRKAIYQGGSAQGYHWAYMEDGG